MRALASQERLTCRRFAVSLGVRRTTVSGLSDPGFESPGLGWAVIGITSSHCAGGDFDGPKDRYLCEFLTRYLILKEARWPGPEQLVHSLPRVRLGHNPFNYKVKRLSGVLAQFALLIPPSDHCQAGRMLRTHARPLIHVPGDPIRGAGPFCRILVPSARAARREPNHHFKRGGREHVNVLTLRRPLPFLLRDRFLREEPWLATSLEVFERCRDLKKRSRKLSTTIPLVDESCNRSTGEN
jgi:hypothetical protein